MEHEHFSQAPIIEAIIDLRVAPVPQINMEQLEQLGDAIASKYPNRQKYVTNQYSFEPGQESIVNASVQTTGLVFTSENGQKVLNVSLEGFTFKILPPYDRWETFQPEARELWKLYCQVCKPKYVVRTAIRYINRLDLPDTLQDLKEYLRIVPELPEDLPQPRLSGYFMQLQLPQHDIAPDCMLILNEALVPTVKPETIAITLDLDLYCAQPDAPWNPDDESIWIFLEQLRNRKNTIFNASITTKMQELIR